MSRKVPATSCKYKSLHMNCLFCRKKSSHRDHLGLVPKIQTRLNMKGQFTCPSEVPVGKVHVELAFTQRDCDQFPPPPHPSMSTLCSVVSKVCFLKLE